MLVIRRRMKRTRHSGRSNGFSLFEALLVIGILVVLAGIFLPKLAGSKRSPRIACVNNLKQIGLSFRVWAADHNKKYPDHVSVTTGGTMELVGSGIAYVHFLVMSNELSTPKVLNCPTDTNRLIATNWSSLRNGNLSYFVGLDAEEARPQMLLSGDDSFNVKGLRPGRGLLELATNNSVTWTTKRHNGAGNLGMADGSVQQVHNASLQQALAQTGVATNRLLMP